MKRSAYPQIQHHGAIDGVTGSCHRFLASPVEHYLIDCGLFQGEEQGGNTLKRHRIEFDLSAVKALIVTHVHIDHIGRLPYLLAAGFSGPIICSIPSAKLLPLVIEDALKVGFTRDRRLIEQCLDKVAGLLLPVAYNLWHPMGDSVNTQVRLQRAGHILGSAYVEIECSSDTAVHRAVFSGDLGAPHAPLLPAPVAPEQANALVIESTYGDRTHEDRTQRRFRLQTAVEHAMANRGTVLIPAFSIGRTQELLYELEDLIHGQPSWADMEIIVDSPLAAKFTEVYRELKPYWDEEATERLRAGRHPLSFDNLYTVDTHEEHLQTVDYLADTGRPAIVLAASGMANGGRILNYLKAMLDNPAHAVLFVGYQARGTIGYYIQKYGREQLGAASGYVDIDGQRHAIKVQVFTIGGYSAHADQQDLLAFVRGMSVWPEEVRIVHGDREARLTLKQKLQAMAAEAGHQWTILLPGID